MLLLVHLIFFFFVIDDVQFRLLYLLAEVGELLNELGHHRKVLLLIEHTNSAVRDV
jgi:hypothetical protein